MFENSALVVTLIAVGMIAIAVVPVVVSAHRRRRLEVIVTGTSGCRFWWDAGFPILELDCAEASSAEAIAILRLAAKCRLRYLELSLRNADDELMPEVGRLSTLEKLFLIRGTVTDRGFENLTGLTRIEVLQAIDLPITKASLNIIKSFRDLEVLDLEGTSLSDDGLEALTCLPKLESLNLSRTSVTHRGLEMLLKHPLLRHLDVTGTPCTSEFVERLLAERGSHVDIDV